MTLQPELIRVRRRKGRIHLTYASEEHESLANTLISVHEEHVGSTRGELDDAVSGCEELGYDYKLVRGLAAVLAEWCDFQSRRVVDPVEARRAVFGEVGRRVIAFENDRNRVLASVAFQLGVSTMDLDRSIYGDLEEEHELASFAAPTPQELLGEYNFKLASGLLSHARRLDIRFRGEDSELVEHASKLGELERSGKDVIRLVVEEGLRGMSGYRASHLEALLSGIVSKSGWSITASVVYPAMSGKVFLFEMREALKRPMLAPSRKPLGLVEAPRKAPARPKLGGEIVDVEATAVKMGVTEAKVKAMYGDGYIDLGDILITEGRLREVREALEGASDMRFDAIRVLLRGLGCKNPVPLLESMGYYVEWNRKRSDSLVYRVS
ncbi:MAG TPA: DUF790 family protein [Patescibacteria group bacterium]|nr:DUF790 family protein [Patescibacteria group bacterium]